MSENKKIIKLIEMQGDRLDDLSESYRVLNDNHTKLSNQFVELRTEVKTTKSFLKWILSPTFVMAALLFLWKVAEHMELM